MEKKPQKRKHDLRTDDDVWGDVQAFKVKNGFKNNNEAVNKLIKKGLGLSD